MSNRSVYAPILGYRTERGNRMEANGTEALRLTVEPGARTMVVRMEGPLLLHTASRVRERLHDLEDRQPGCLVADLREVTDIDSTGLAVLLWMHRTQVKGEAPPAA